MPDVRIELATCDDAAAVGEIFVAARAVTLPFLTELHTPAAMKVWLRDTVLPRNTTWVARTERRAVGFMTLEGPHIEHLYLEPSYLRQGIGSALVAHAKRSHPAGLELVTFQKNERARAFYEACEFRAVCFRDGRSNEEGEPDIVYEWRSNVA